MPMFRRTEFGTGKKDWLGSAHGVNNATTGTLKIADFTESTHYPDGYIPSGTPVDVTDLTAVVPYTAPAENEPANHLGFLLDNIVVIDGEATPAAILRHGSIVAANVPGTFTAPASAVGFIFE